MMMNRHEQIEKLVQCWIDENFEVETIKIEKFELFPHGKRLIDVRGNEMVVFFDYLKNCVDYRYPDGE